MGSTLALAAVGQTIVSILSAAGSGEFAGAQFKVFRTEDFEHPMELGVSVYLYRVEAESISRMPPALERRSKRRSPALPLTLHYLITPWAPDAAAEHRLLAGAMRVIEDQPVFAAQLLNATSHGAFDDNESVDLVLENLSLADETDLWRGLGVRYRLGVSYVARVILRGSDGSDTFARQ
jgi:hypothetical protein